MLDITEPNLACRGEVERTEESSGSTTTNPKALETPSKPIKNTRQNLFSSLSTELHMNIMAQMHKDPVSQICLSLTSQHWHRVFHYVVDIQPASPFCTNAEQKARYVAIAPDLRCQISKDETHMLYGSREYWYLLDVWDLEWSRPLWQLLLEEKWLWRGVKFCGGCGKFKPESAYRSFYWERRMLSKHIDKVKNTPLSFQEQYTTLCRRCRAKHILLTFERRIEFFDHLEAVAEEQPSLGLKDPNSPLAELPWETRTELLRSQSRGSLVVMVDKGMDVEVGGMMGDEFEARRWGYVLWREVWEELGI